MTQTLPWTPWHQVVKLREDVRTGELSLADFAADLHDVAMQKGVRPVYENPDRFFSLTYPTLSLRDLARDVALRLAGKNTKAIRQLELTYGGGKTHTLVTLRHLVNDPDSLPTLPTVEQFRSHIGAALPASRVAVLCFDKLDVEKGMNTRGPEGEFRWLRHPWSVLAFQIAGEDGLRALHPDDANEERETPPAEPVLVDLLSRPQEEGLATLILIDEVLMYAREKAAMEDVWRTHLVNFFQYLCQATVKVDRCALVASLLASDPSKSDTFGKELSREIFDIFNRQKEEGVQPVQREDVTEVLRRRFFTTESIIDTDSFRPHVTAAVANIAEVSEAVKKDRQNAEQRFLNSYPFHPDLTDIFYTKWTQLDGFQRTRGILRTFAIALRDAEPWDMSPLVGPGVFLPAPGEGAIAEAARELAGIATREVTDSTGNDWSAVLGGELDKTRMIQDEQPALKFREMEQAVCTAFLSSQPIGQKATTSELMVLLGATRPDRIELEKGMRHWTDISWFLDEAEFASEEEADSGSDALPRSWRLGNRPNLKQMHHDACVNRVTDELVEQELLVGVRQMKDLSRGTPAGIRVHMLPERPQDIQDDGDFHFAILGPGTASDSGKPSAKACRFINETTGSDKPRRHRNAIVLAAPSRDGLDAVRASIREYLGWKDVHSQLGEGTLDPAREAVLTHHMQQARDRIPEAIRQAWAIILTVNEHNSIHAFKVPVGAEPLFHTVKAHRHARIQETAISPEAMMPGGPYDLWREDEASRRVKDLVSAFAENPRLPKMLRHKEILDTINQGVHDGVFVASLVRPDKSVKTWWRTPIDEAARTEPALELFLPGKAALSDLDPNLLAPGVLPELWTEKAELSDLDPAAPAPDVPSELWAGESVAVATVAAYFVGGRTVIVQRESYTESVTIPACPRDAVDAAISDAVREGVLWLVNGPASFQHESLPLGVLTDSAELRTPMQSLPVDCLTKNAVPNAWKDGLTSAAALLTALSVKLGAPLPWLILRRTIDNAISARWIELVPDSGLWPCEAADASAVTLKEPDGVGGGDPLPEAYIGAADLEPNELQDLVEVLSDVVASAVGVPLQLHLRVTLGGSGAPVPPEKVLSVNKILEGVNPDLRLKK